MAVRQKFEEVDGVTAAPGTTKARIERAAVLAFVAKGVDAVTTREIAAGAGISEGALYRHFRAKEELAETLFFTVHARLAEAVIAASRAHDAIDDQAGAFVRAYCEIADADWPLFTYHVLYTHRFLPRPGETATDPPNSPVAEAERVIAAAMAGGQLPTGDARVKAAMALGAVLQTALHVAYGRISLPMSQHARQLTAAVIAVLRS